MNLNGTDSGERIVVTRSPAVTLERVGEGGAILYDRRSGRGHLINAAAAELWDLCDGSPELEELAQAFGAVHALPAAAVRDDVAATVADFRAMGLLA
jgi:PqqD family protein of HPr-rel-A system